MTKYQMIRKFYDIVCRSEVKDYSKRLIELSDKNRITTGAYFVWNHYDNYHYQKLSGLKIDRTKKWDINYHLENFIKDMEKTKKFIEYNETCNFEDSQMQVLIKEGKIKYEL